jgi:hypothetical protein
MRIADVEPREAIQIEKVAAHRGQAETLLIHR